MIIHLVKKLMGNTSSYTVIDSPNAWSGCPLTPLAQWVDPDISNEETIENEISRVQIKDMVLPNFFVRTSEGSFTKDAVLLNTAGQGLNLIGSCLFPKVKMCTRVSSASYVASHNGTQNFKYDPNNEFEHRIPAQTPFHIVHFSVYPDYFLQYLPEYEAWADDLKNRIAKGERLIGSHSPNISLVQQRILQNIMDCPLTGKMATLMMEASIVQIMLLQLNAIFQRPEASPNAVDKKDKETAQEVKEFLLRHYLDEHSLESLSRHFGINTNKLMSLFKKTFGKSLFEYISELKMDFAHKMLHAEGKSVVEVSRLTGYKNANHFSTAFKKRFGVSPSHVN